MANRTDVAALTVHGTNPQNLVEKIIRSKIYECMYWKEHCFAVNAETIVDQAMELKAVGGTFGGARMPSNFMCLILKLLQIQPDQAVVREYILQSDSKYLRLLGAFYLRLTGKNDQVYRYLEPLYNDMRKVRQLRSDGGYEMNHMDRLAEDMLYKDYLFDIALPRLPRRNELEDLGMLGPRVSGLDESNIAKMEEVIAAEQAKLKKQQLEEHVAAEAAKREAQEKKVIPTRRMYSERGRQRDGEGRDRRGRADTARPDHGDRGGGSYRGRETDDDERDGGGAGRLRFKDGDRVRDSGRRREDRDGGCRDRGRDRSGYGDEDDDVDDERRGAYRDRSNDRRRDRDYGSPSGDRGYRDGGDDWGERDGYRRSEYCGDRDYERDRDRDRDRERSGRYARDRDDYGRDRDDRRDRGGGESGERDRSGYRDSGGDRGEHRRDGRDRDRDKHRDRDDGKSQAERDRAEKKRGGGKGGKKDGAEEMSVEETNKLRAELGLPPLK